MKLFYVHKNVMSGQCKRALIRIQIRYTAIFLLPDCFPGWTGSHLGVFAPSKTRNGYGCSGFYFRPWLAPDVAVVRLPKWYRTLSNSLSFRTRGCA